MSEFYNLVKMRQSCRNYDSEKAVENEKLEKVIKTALLSPSAVNSQPWHFTVVNSKDKSKEIAKAVQRAGLNKFTSSCPAFIIINEEKSNILSKIGGKVVGQKYALTDIGIATAHIILAAQDIGLSTCIMGMFDEDEVKKICDIRKNKRVRLIIAIGYAKNDEIRIKKRKLEDETVTYITD